MSISVVIPAYNCSNTIRATLDSVFGQTLKASEIIVLDDGSTDESFAILESYKPRISLFRQSNRGVAATRNELVKKTTGELVAFIDNDDLWHPTYLETQYRLYQMYPEAVAFFSGHVNFHGDGLFDWPAETIFDMGLAELIPSLRFLQEYNRNTGAFASMSYCCVPKSVLLLLGDEPFHTELSGVDDSYLCTALPLVGPVVHYAGNLVAYRITSTNQSRNRLKMFALWVDVFRHLEPRYMGQGTADLISMFRKAYASKRRGYAKILMGAGYKTMARQQLKISVGNCCELSSIIKSLALLVSTYMPRILQPCWPSAYR